MISISDLSKVYRTESVETTALDKLNLSIQKGSFVAIKGPSGSGKYITPYFGFAGYANQWNLHS
jgi:ABC-type lipoprotein export system ATPase subunit